MNFRILTKDHQTKARTGLVSTAHGDFETPMFMPVGTAGSVKAVHQHELKNDIKAKIILCNTYHLYLRPGISTIEKAGGLHRFIGWDLPILSDSGGYQVFSMSDIRKVTEEGTVFRSHIDGSKHIFTPENVVDIQRILGSDIIMAFDECTPYPCDYQYAEKSLNLTERWLVRGIQQFNATKGICEYEQGFFPVVQGSVYRDLRKRSAEFISSLGCDGNAIGGLSVGEPAEEMNEMIEVVNDSLPEDKPRYLMGVGTPANIIEAVSLGIDMFDCVIPSRNGRNGMLYTSEGVLNMKNKKWENDFSAVDPEGNTFADKQYSKAYLRHLFHNREILAAQIATVHNLGFYLRLMKEIRNHIQQGDFHEWKKKVMVKLQTRL
jgi:queuine tRNA-ribosyltransferase